jgi:predicted ATPase
VREHDSVGSIAIADEAQPAPATNFPSPATDLIGRETELAEVANLVTARRMVTLTGTGGIGKTRLGHEVARRLALAFSDGTWLAELSPLADPTLVPVTVAAVLGLELTLGPIAPERVANALGRKQILLMLDNCEHVIDAAANMAEALLRANPAACVLATSREPLGAEGETVYRVPPLDVPPEDAGDAEEVLRHGAVRLFVARARAASTGLSLDDHTARVAARICRRLDGIPLAIELAAARAPALGMEGLAKQLGDSFRLLTGGRRTALPRHRTLQATLDWSYDLLVEAERVVLRRLAIFAGGFGLEAAATVAGGDDIGQSEFVDLLTQLVSKSLVVAEIGGAVAAYRLLETTRAYAREKLIGCGELEAVARRHAEYYRDLCERAEAEWETTPRAQWSRMYAGCLDNVRAALDWCFHPDGETAIGIALTVAAVPLWIQLSLMDECRTRVERALTPIGRKSIRGTRHELQLQVALGQALMYTKGTMSEAGAAWARALDLAKSLADADYHLRALWGSWVYYISRGEYAAALANANQFRSLADTLSDAAAVLVGDRMLGVLLHYSGDQTNARPYIERVVRQYVTPAGSSVPVRFLLDQRSTALVSLTRILWLQGYADQAMQAAHDCVEEALASDHAMSLCYALADAAAPIALQVGDRAVADRFVTMLLERSANHGLSVWHTWGRCLRATILSNHGDVSSSVLLFRAALEEFRESGFALRYVGFLGSFAEALGRAGSVEEALATIDDALDRSERSEERWCFAELLRIKGELTRRTGAPDAGASAERHFRQALAWARRQRVPAFELRAATSLASLCRDQGRTAKARAALVPVYGGFTEGFATADLRAARELLDALR